MTKESVEKFFEALKKNSELNRKFKSLMDYCLNDKGNLFSSKIADFANESGFDCSAADITDSLKNSSFPDDELASASGGNHKMLSQKELYESIELKKNNKLSYHGFYPDNNK